MTGRNPGKHGVYGFTDVRPGTLTMFFPNFGNVKSDTRWDVAGRAVLDAVDPAALALPGIGRKRDAPCAVGKQPPEVDGKAASIQRPQRLEQADRDPG